MIPESDCALWFRLEGRFAFGARLGFLGFGRRFVFCDSLGFFEERDQFGVALLIGYGG